MNDSGNSDGGNSSRRDVICLLLCLLIALGLRFGVMWREPSQLTLDRDAYLGIATSMAEGRGYSSPNSTSPTAFRPPLYPMMLAAGLRVFPTAVVVGGINLLAGLLTVWLTARAGTQLNVGVSRFVAALLVAVDPLLVQYNSQPMTESVCTFLAVLWLNSSICRIAVSNGTGQSETTRTGSLVGGLACGVTFGLLVLSRPTFWMIAAAYGFGWLLFCCRSFAAGRFNLSLYFKSAIWPVAGAAIVVAPWVVRNWIVLGTPILTTTHGGYTLLLGNNPVFYNEVVKQPWGTTWPDASQKAWESDLESRMADELGSPSSEVARDIWQSRVAKSYIRAEPGHFLESMAHRVRSLWNTVPQGDAAAGINPWIIIGVGWYYTIVLAVSLIGAIRILMSDQRLRWVPLYVLIVSVQIVHLFYWTNTRMRAPLTPAIALFAAAAIQSRKQRIVS